MCFGPWQQSYIALEFPQWQWFIGFLGRLQWLAKLRVLYRPETIIMKKKPRKGWMSAFHFFAHLLPNSASSSNENNGEEFLDPRLRRNGMSNSRGPPGSVTDATQKNVISRIVANGS